MVKQWMRFLKIVADNGGEVDSETLSKELGVHRATVFVNGKALMSRGFLRKRTEIKYSVEYPGLIRKKSYWRFREQKKEKALQILRKIFGEQYE